MKYPTPGHSKGAGTASVVPPLPIMPGGGTPLLNKGSSAVVVPALTPVLSGTEAPFPDKGASVTPQVGAVE